MVGFPQVTTSANTLALLGGSPIIDHTLSPYRTVGEEERAAVDRVMQSGNLSGFIGEWCDEFNGGPEIQAFEAAWTNHFGTKHSVSVNSNTSGLFAAMGAIGIGPGDEVIVPPYTMSATAMAPLIYGGIPVFADIEPDTFCIDPAQVAAAITDRTCAIIAVNLFGHPAALHELRALADRHSIYLIEDNAQAPLATENNRFAGTIGHIGVFSLNYHKHIHTGEGGMCLTDDNDLALRLRAIRNHGENIVTPLGIGDLTNLVGFNFRMTEMSAAIGVEQLKKAPTLVGRRVEISQRLSAAIRDLPGLTPPVERQNCRHVYYLWGARYDARVTGVPRDTFARALVAEGVPVWQGYVAPLYRLPIFQQRIAVGSSGFPFNLSDRTYAHNMCPVAERCHEHELIELSVCSFDISNAEEIAIADAFAKVADNLPALAASGRSVAS